MTIISPKKNHDIPSQGSSTSLAFSLNMISPNREIPLPHSTTNIYKILSPDNQSPEKKRITLQLTKKLEQLPPFDFDKIVVDNQIGEGNYGKIYKAVYKGKSMAMKKLLFDDEQKLLHNKLEYRIMHTNKHKNIPEIYGSYEKRLDPTTISLYVLMELAICDWDKEILERAKAKNYYSEKELIAILKQMLAVLAILQGKDIAHGDIKPSNILVADDNLYKLTDFGEAINCVLVNKEKTRGTELFLSPEKYNNIHQYHEPSYDKFKSDCYSLGLSMIYAAALSLTPIYEIKKEENNVNLSRNIRCYVESNYSRTFCEVLYRMTNFTEAKRCDFIALQDIVNSLF
jgi:serine/threonine protein kinase